MIKKRRRISITVSEATENALISLRDKCKLRSTATVLEGMLSLFLEAMEHRNNGTRPEVRQSLTDEVEALFAMLSNWEPTPEPGERPVRHPNQNRYAAPPG